MGKAVGFFVEHAPGDLPAEGQSVGGFGEFEFFPGDAAGLQPLRIQLHQSHFIPVEPGVLFQYVYDGRHATVLQFLFSQSRFTVKP